MAGATQPQRTDQRKRNRKRKRRNVSISSSSESSDSSDSSSDEQVVKMPTKTSKAPPLHESSSSSSSSSEDESSESERDESHSARKFQSTSSQAAAPSNAQDEILPPASGSPNLHTRPPSPPPLRNVPAPQLIPQRDAAGNVSSADSEKDKELKDKFRKFWMSSIADAFSDDLNEIRKEPNLNQSRLGLLIDSLASGADLYSTSREMGSSKVNEIGIILGDKSPS